MMNYKKMKRIIFLLFIINSCSIHKKDITNEINKEGYAVNFIEYDKKYEIDIDNDGKKDSVKVFIDADGYISIEVNNHKKIIGYGEEGVKSVIINDNNGNYCIGIAIHYVNDTRKSEFYRLNKENIVYSTISDTEELCFYVMIPDFKLSTERARSVLPKSYLVSDAINNMSKLGLLVNAFNKKDYSNLRFFLGDKIHQPYRFALINNSEKIFAASKEYGALGEYISGAGPTLISLNYDNDEFLENMKQMLDTLEDKWTIEKKKLNLKGAEVYDEEIF